ARRDLRALPRGRRNLELCGPGAARQRGSQRPRARGVGHRGAEEARQRNCFGRSTYRTSSVRGSENMNANLPSHGLQLASTLTADGTLTLELADIPVPQPGPDEVVVRIEASPINPSDLLSMIPAGDVKTARFEGTAARPKVMMATRS